VRTEASPRRQADVAGWIVLSGNLPPKNKTQPSADVLAERGEAVKDSGWRVALKWGFGAALAHRLLLGIWMASVWITISSWTTYDADFDAIRVDGLPRLSTPAAQVIFGVWRRWDANHYLSLAVHGYQPENPGPTVFGVLTPLAFQFLDRALPGPVDLGAMVFETLAFGLALTLLFRLCVVDYGDGQLAHWAVGVAVLQPLSYVFAAPLSESAYLALALGAVYAAYRERWLLAALCGLLATLARIQGVLLAVVVGLILLSTTRARQGGVREMVRRGWSLILIPLGGLLFLGFRSIQGLPSLGNVYAHHSYLVYADPFSSLFFNARHFVRQWPHSLYDADLLTLAVSLALGVLMLRYPRHRRLPMVAYTWMHLLLFLSKVNLTQGTQEVTHSQSFGRYALVLFPLTIMVADGLRQIRSERVRFACVVGGSLLLLVFSARHVLYLIGP